MAAYKALQAVGNVMGGGNKPPVQGPPNWQTDLFGFMEDTSVCLQTMCCPFCTETNMIMMRERGVPQLDPMTCCGVCCIEILTRGFFSTALGLGLRRELVQRYGIQEEPYCNSVVMNICVGCNYCQMQREMAKRGEHPGGIFASPPAQEGGMGAKIASGAKMGAFVTGTAAGFGSELFDFAGAEDCIDSCCLSCCTLAHMANRLDAGRVQAIPANTENKMDPITCLGAYCCMFQFLYAVRRETIDKYDIAEPHLMTAVLMAFCGCCMLAQTRREMGYRGEWPSGLLLKEAPPKK